MAQYSDKTGIWQLSAIGTKQSSSEVGSMSAFEPKGDVIVNQATSRR